MSEITGKYIIRFQLKLTANLHIGSGVASIDTDALCARNSDGSIVIRGSSLAGIFRSNLERIFGEDDVIKAFFGKVENASNIYFEDAVIEGNRYPSTDIRDGVGINRKLQSAQDRCKYDKETVLKGSVFPCIITINYTESTKTGIDKILDYIKICFYNLNKGLTPLGGSASRGLGFCKINEARYCHLDFSGAAKSALTDYLLNDFYDYSNAINENNIASYFKNFAFEEKIDLPPSENNHFQYSIKIQYEIETIEPLLIKGARTNDEDVDSQFIKTNGSCFIPGSSIKGPFRSRAEMILRTMNVAGICDPVTNSCFKQKKDTPCVVCKLFGFSGQKSKVLFSDLNPKNNEVKIKYFDHNQIDRFTGGTIKNALFDEKLVFHAVFEGTIVIENADIIELKLLTHIFKDMYSGDIRIGYGKAKGYGKVIGKITKLELFTTDVSRLGEKPFESYGFKFDRFDRFDRNESIYRILDIGNINDSSNSKKFVKEVISEINSCEWKNE